MRNTLNPEQKILHEYYAGNDQPLAHFLNNKWDLLLLRTYQKLKNIDWSKDVLQDVILHFLSHPQEVRPMKIKPNIENLIGFFIRVTERAAINALHQKINQAQHLDQLLVQQNLTNKNTITMSDDNIFDSLNEDKREQFLEEVKSILAEKAAKKPAAMIDVKVYELMLLVQSREISEQLNLPIEEVEVIKKRIRRVMKKVKIRFL